MTPSSQPSGVSRLAEAAVGTKIVRAEWRRLALPTGIKPFVLPNGRTTPTDLAALLIRLVDDEGVAGQSLLWAQHEGQLPLFEAGLAYFAGLVEGQTLEETSTIDAALRRAAAFVGPEGVIAFAIAGINMAVDDLVCRRLDASLSSVLGRRHERIRAYQTGLMLNATIDELVEEAARIYDSGVRAVKMVLGKPTVGEDVERVAAVKASLPADAFLMADALQRWDRTQAMEAFERLAEHDLVWLEDPISHEDVEGYRILAANGAIPVATGESLFSMARFEELIAAEVPYVIGELERVGGFREWMRVAERVQEASLSMLSHIYPQVSAQLAAALHQDEVWWEYVPWFDRLVEGEVRVVDGYLDVPDVAGSGFDPDPDAVERFSRSPWTAFGG